MIAVISDSHIPDRAEKIPEEFHKKLDRADVVVHCGDFESEDKYRNLVERYDVIGVKGNCDYFEIESSKKFTRNKVEFGVYHGAGINPRGHHPTLAKTAEKLSVDVLFHGHTHQQEVAEHEGKIVLNPGSCTGVGGGSSSEKDPSMITVETSHGQEIDIKIFTKSLESGEIQVSKEKQLNL